MKFSNTITLDKDLLKDLPTLEVIKDGNTKYYLTQEVSNGQINFINISNRNDEYIINIRNLVPENEMGLILNIDDYYTDLKNAAINQEIIEYQTEKRVASYNY